MLIVRGMIEVRRHTITTESYQLITQGFGGWVEPGAQEALYRSVRV